MFKAEFLFFNKLKFRNFVCVQMYILVFVNVKFTNLHEQDTEKIHEQIEKNCPAFPPY